MARYITKELIGMTVLLVVVFLIFLAIGKWYPGSGAEQVDWTPTRSPELEAQLELWSCWSHACPASPVSGSSSARQCDQGRGQEQ